MAVDTPATIAVLGAGPIGLEAALYARFLGYDVQVYERDVVGGNVLRWGHVQMFSPFGMNRSTLGLAAITAQDPSWQAPSDELLMTGREFVERYLVPLAQTDLLVDQIRERTTVISVGRVAGSKTDPVGDTGRTDSPFLLLVRDQNGSESHSEADIVIDASGVYNQHCWMGQGGLPALGEQALEANIVYELPDIQGRDRADYVGVHTMVVGSGYSAATSVSGLAELAADTEPARITWVTRAADHDAVGPIVRIPNDRLAARDSVAQRANQIATDGTAEYLPGSQVRRIVRDNETGGFRITLSGQHTGEMQVDRVIANVGYRPDRTIYDELQVQQCYATEGPMKLAASLLDQSSSGQPSGDCLDQVAPCSTSLLTSEPNFYILGGKSYGRDSRFLLAVGLEQIRQIFSIIGDREDLNLYDGVQNLLR